MCVVDMYSIYWFEFVCLMIRRLPRFTRTDTLFPYTTLFQSVGHSRRMRLPRCEPSASCHTLVINDGRSSIAEASAGEIGRAHVCTPVTNAHHVCRLLLEKKKQLIFNPTTYPNKPNNQIHNILQT